MSSKKIAAVWLVVVLSWLLAVAASLVAARSYVGPVVVALVGAMFHWLCAGWLRHKTRPSGRIVLFVLTLPLLVLTIDNIGRAVHMMGGPLLRLLI